MLQERREKGKEVILFNVNANDIQMHDPSAWAISHIDNSWLELPPFLEGDASVEQVFVCATEKSFRYGEQQDNGVMAIVICRNVFVQDAHDLLVFDQLYQKVVPEGDAKRQEELNQTMPTWHQLRTCQLKLSHSKSDICGTGFALDSFLLILSMDGTLFAHPRNNPRSVYFVKKFPFECISMTSNYNILAVRTTSHTLVFSIERTTVDPFIYLAQKHQVQLPPDKRETGGEEKFSFNEFYVLLFGPFIAYQEKALVLKQKITVKVEYVETEDDGMPDMGWRIKRSRKAYRKLKGIELPKREIRSEKREWIVDQDASWRVSNFETSESFSVSQQNFSCVPFKWNFSHLKILNHKFVVVTFQRQMECRDFLIFW